MSGEVVVGWRWSGLMLPRWWPAVGSSTEKYFRLGDLSTLENRCFWVLRRIQRQQLGLLSPERDVDVCSPTYGLPASHRGERASPHGGPLTLACAMQSLVDGKFFMFLHTSLS